MPKLPDSLFLYDGAKSTPLSEMRFSELTGQPVDQTTLDPLAAYRVVPWLFRAVDLRAKAMQKMPLALYTGKGAQDLSESDRYAPLVRRLRLLLLLSEASLCLHARTYWALETNAFGANLTPRWIVPTTITADYEHGEPTRFTRRIGGTERTIPADQLLYCWYPSLTADVGPGVAPALVAGHAAGVLHHLDRYLAHYFERGAIRATLLQIDGNPPKAEKDKLEAWWKRMIGGVKKAFETVAISAAVKPIVIGDSLKETVNKDLTQQQREEIATALGVPFTLLNANAANYATANQDWVNLYDQTIVPDAELLEQAINEQYLSRLNLRLEFDADRLPCYQAALLDRARAMKELVGTPVLTRDEGREMLGYGPWPEGEPDPATLLPARTPPAPAPAPPLPEPDQDDQDDQDAAKALDLGKWERKALKRIGQAVPFASRTIPIEDQQAIAAALPTCTDAHAVKHLFSTFTKALTLTDPEQRLFDALAPVFAKHGAKLSTAIRNDGTLDLTQLSADLKAALLPLLVEYALDEIGTLAELIGPDVEPGQMATTVSTWADTYCGALVTGITDSTQTIIQQAVSAFTSTPGMTREQLEALLRPAFGAKRAETIAVTEVTRAKAGAATQYQRYLADAGLSLERINDTNADDRVCLVCGPLNGKSEDAWPDPAGPPWHPRCRCAVRLRRTRARA